MTINHHGAIEIADSSHSDIGIPGLRRNPTPPSSSTGVIICDPVDHHEPVESSASSPRLAEARMQILSKKIQERKEAIQQLSIEEADLPAINAPKTQLGVVVSPPEAEEGPMLHGITEVERALEERTTSRPSVTIHLPVERKSSPFVRGLKRTAMLPVRLAKSILDLLVEYVIAPICYIVSGSFLTLYITGNFHLVSEHWQNVAPLNPASWVQFLINVAVAASIAFSKLFMTLVDKL